MKKTVSLLLLMVLLFSVLATASLAETTQRELNFFLTYSKEKVGLHEVIRQFEEANPDIKLNLTIITDLTEAQKQFNIMIAGDMLPDLVDLDGPNHAAYVKMGIFQDLTDKINAELPVDQYYEGPMESVMVDGKIYGLPFTTNNIAVFYNKDMFDAAGIDKFPETWDELLDACNKLKKDGFYPMATSCTLTMDGTFRFYPYLWGAGGDIDKLDNQGTLDTLNLFKTFVDEKIMNVEVANWTPADATNQFINGKAAMVLEGPWRIGSVTKDAKFNWGVAPMPAGAEKRATCLGGHTMAVIKGGNEEDAWKLMKWFQDPARMEHFMATDGYLPTRKDVMAQTPLFNEGAFKVFADSAAFALPRGPHANWPKIEQVIQEMMQSVVVGTKTPEQAQKDAVEAMPALLQ